MRCGGAFPPLVLNEMINQWQINEKSRAYNLEKENYNLIGNLFSDETLFVLAQRPSITTLNDHEFEKEAITDLIAPLSE